MRDHQSVCPGRTREDCAARFAGNPPEARTPWSVFTGFCARWLAEGQLTPMQAAGRRANKYAPRTFPKRASGASGLRSAARRRQERSRSSIPQRVLALRGFITGIFRRVARLKKQFFFVDSVQFFIFLRQNHAENGRRLSGDAAEDRLDYPRLPAHNFLDSPAVKTVFFC